MEFINLSSFDWAMRRNWEVPAVFRDGLNPRRSCSYFEEFDVVFVAEPAKPSVVPAATRIKGRSGARIDLSERPRVTSLCCQHQIRALSLSAIVYVLKQMFYLFIFHGLTEYSVSGRSASRSANKWILWNVQQVMNLSCWGGKIEDFSSCCAACVEFVRNPSKQDCNCGELCSSILPSSGLELLAGRIPSLSFWSCLDDRSFHQSHLQSPRKYFCYFFCSWLLLLDWRLQAVAAWLDW